MRKRADDGELISMLSDTTEVLANLNTRHVGRDWFELAPYFGRRIGFQIKSIKLAWTAPHEKKDTGFGFRSSCWTGCLVRMKQSIPISES